VQIDDELAEAHTALSLAKLFCDWDWAGAEREAMRALQLNPRNAMAHDSYGWYLVDVGRADEALEQMKQAAQLEPHSITISGDMAWLLFFSRRYDEAIQQGRRTLALDPNAVDMLDALSNLYAQKGDFPAAIATAERIKPWDEALATSILGWIAARTGKRAEALESLNTLDRLFAQQRHIPTPPPWRALLYASLGENERALDWLEKAVDERPPFVVWITVHPALDRLRSDPRFAQLLKKMNLPP
jgi:tetratricopeptide (TPR) repeat protein